MDKRILVIVFFIFSTSAHAFKPHVQYVCNDENGNKIAVEFTKSYKKLLLNGNNGTICHEDDAGVYLCRNKKNLEIMMSTGCYDTNECHELELSVNNWYDRVDVECERR